MIIVCLVVLVPLVACVHSVEVLGLTRPVLVMPPVHLHTNVLLVQSMCLKLASDCLAVNLHLLLDISNSFEPATDNDT